MADRLKSNAVREKSYAFAINAIGLARLLRNNHEYELAGQFLRCGTSIGANIEEAQSGISRPDFIAKMAIASKEARETLYWLRLIRDARLLADDQIAPCLREVQELVRLLTAIVKTSQKSKSPQLKIQHSQLNIVGRTDA